MKSKGLKKNAEVWTVGLHCIFRVFDNSLDHWEIRGRSNRTTFLLGVTTGLLSKAVFMGV
ncbi:hypothetical protein HMPREF3188_00448 [Tissierellia bacterium KA00581]|nr:hypothetical protein HMPREF3188_00448 [Tissierellia bacterium KA00581]